MPPFFTHKNNIEEFTTKLGDFYDLCMAVNFLSDDYVALISEEAKSLCYLLKRYFEEKKEELKNLIISTLYGIAYENNEKGIILDVIST